jgi:hypothetical protein
MTVTEAFLDQFREGDGDTDLVNLSSVAPPAREFAASGRFRRWWQVMGSNQRRLALASAKTANDDQRGIRISYCGPIPDAETPWAIDWHAAPPRPAKFRRVGPATPAPDDAPRLSTGREPR